MIEIPEATVLASQLNAEVSGKTIRSAVAAYSPHKFTGYTGDPADYPDLLDGKTMGAAYARGGMVELQAGDMLLLFNDGVNLRLHTAGGERPKKHQLLLEYEDGAALSASVAMYGGIACFIPGTYDNPYYLVACEKPSPLGEDFSAEYFAGLFLPEREKLSLKAFLATEQRIPGLGNGVLQDILYTAGLHPKRKLSTLGQDEREKLYDSLKTTLEAMTQGGGRDTERDLYGQPGGYLTRLSRNTVGGSCPVCGETIQKQSYMGGSIYICPGCQSLA